MKRILTLAIILAAIAAGFSWGDHISSYHSVPIAGMNDGGFY